MARKRRGLSEEDRAIWDRVAASVTRHAPATQPAPAADRTAPPKAPAPHPAREAGSSVSGNRIPEFRIGERARPGAARHEISPPISEQIARNPVRMDSKAFGRMKKGKLAPEARIDLHGMTQDRAHPVLTRFISESYMRQMRLVLVITGKGKDRDEPGPMPVPRGVLKHQVPQWLTSGPLRLMVLQIAEAHLKHGGTGAYYVYLRRHR
ncbi:Smr/MutS family protein [Mangrovicoccus algicola]|uniref:Smr/MutS family protein n=1 Tax=Mangrovicoccus algicola TaxID=2771008 RepID=A0A8J7CWW6_9RHOB|nr:Smr/MutS family protein [Mangrovicoccus algicola]MBE3638262.1 Smr/MutS family protein [Mangrovicoccus algicola]